MVMTRTVDSRWIKRYKLFFIIGTLILALQIYLAVRFFTLTAGKSTNNVWNPHNIILQDDNELSVNSARKYKDLPIDDEDQLKSNKINKPVNKAVISKPNNARLRLEELDFFPSCDITSKEAISAIHRAKTQRCKQKIANITCLIQNGLLYPRNLPNSCLNDGYKIGRSLGCYKDEKKFRLLSGYYGNYKVDNSPEYCIRLCLQSGFPYAGVQYSTECFCGNDEPALTTKLPDSSCNMKCPANPHLICGGYFTVNVYETGIAKFYPQVASTSTNLNLKPVKIVFLLTLNGRALKQVKRLIKILFHRDHYFYIHVDVRQDYLFRELLHLERQFPNIRLTRKRFATIWGGASLLTMLLSAMRELLIDLPQWHWDFVLNLSESDYPVKTVDKLVEFLTANRDRNFVKSHGREVQRFIQKQGLDKTFVECDAHMWRIGTRTLPWGIQVDGGSDWVALSRRFTTYVTFEPADSLIRGLLILFGHTLLPAESFFHTALRNSAFCDTYIDNNLHVTNWKRKLGCKCQYKHIVDWCGCSPNDFKPEDWQRIQNTESRQLYFARKFEPIINQAVILQLEQWLFNDEEYGTSIKNINSYWQSIYNHLDLSPKEDDNLLTLARTVIRIVLKNLNCVNELYNIIEINSYHTDDSYNSSLIKFDFKTNPKAILEISFKPKNRLQFYITSSQFATRILSLYVSSDYDQKEQLSRNYLRVLGPYSDPQLIYHFTSNPGNLKATNISIVWIDPAGRLADISDLSIDDTNLLGSIKIGVKQPLLPGTWNVKIIFKNKLSAQTKFLITPLLTFSGNPVLQNQVYFLHAGSDVSYKDFDSGWEKVLPNPIERESLERLSIANSKRYGPDLEEWVESLFLQFYSIGEVCFQNFVNVCQVNGTEFVLCKVTDWSSLTDDPKSFIGGFNESTGRFDFM